MKKYFLITSTVVTFSLVPFFFSIAKKPIDAAYLDDHQDVSVSLAEETDLVNYKNILIALNKNSMNNHS